MPSYTLFFHIYWQSGHNRRPLESGFGEMSVSFDRGAATKREDMAPSSIMRKGTCFVLFFVWQTSLWSLQYLCTTLVPWNTRHARRSHCSISSASRETAVAFDLAKKSSPWATMGTLMSRTRMTRTRIQHLLPEDRFFVVRLPCRKFFRRWRRVSVKRLWKRKVWEVPPSLFEMPFWGTRTVPQVSTNLAYQLDIFISLYLFALGEVSKLYFDFCSGVSGSYDPYANPESVLRNLFTIICRRLINYQHLDRIQLAAVWMMVVLTFIEPPVWCQRWDPDDKESCVHLLTKTGIAMGEDESSDPVLYYPNTKSMLLSTDQSFIVECTCLLIVLFFSLLRFGRYVFCILFPLYHLQMRQKYDSQQKFALQWWYVFASFLSSRRDSVYSHYPPYLCPWLNCWNGYEISDLPAISPGNTPLLFHAYGYSVTSSLGADASRNYECTRSSGCFYYFLRVVRMRHVCWYTWGRWSFS